MEERPAIVGGKKHAGGFETDTIAGKAQKNGLPVAVGRVTKFAIIRKIKNSKPDMLQESLPGL
ncbi:hypothetical protein [Neisseria iguanae]|uniref:Uncharacterized protein n=1 Tax=Neisseria iguanae TaxID=90242 RepID=A0A2P7TWP1_9NEIS|nr:hypothetical protein [Neisseria iguanae]PSJ79152.1 hypothetical protein C7N83_14030 [Neisseria iguanae]